ncbi:MAG: FUSC family protein [Saprospiraceae bacterium]|nr:FUSC family protein [Saprospiraceae bacterium]
MTTDNSLYALRCIIGVVLCYVLFIYFPHLPFQWSMVSVVVAISPDNKVSLAIDRMKANLLGCAIGFFLFFIHPPNLILLCIGVIMVIITGLYFELQGSIRSALAALVILMLYNGPVHDWTLAFNRLICVVIGCLIALIVTLSFNYIFKLLNIKSSEDKNTKTGDIL